MNLKQKNLIRYLPTEPGVYKFYDSENRLLYVGKAKAIKKRVSSYFTNKSLGYKTTRLVKQIARVSYIKVFSEFEALLLEADLIRKYKPFYNIQSKDDKSPIYITISNEHIPTISAVRKSNLDLKQNIYTKGPFPSARITREVLKEIRRIFPYCHHKNAKKPCLFVHLGLCPYPQKSEKDRLKYLKTISKIKKLLDGKNSLLRREITREMDSYAKREKFEQAQTAKLELQKIEYIASTYRTPREFLERPTLVDDLTNMRLVDLKKNLGLNKLPRRIECFDISNVSGKFATGSMVVFQDGKAQKSEYRKFKIKYKDTPDDYEMLREVLSRRFKNSWPDADLIIIDGGRGQLSVAIAVLKQYKKQITVISLAKRLEEIFTEGKKEPIILPKESPARQIAQAARDEAHRFAINYHRLLRSRDFISKA